jgi:phosphoribosylanthranilate isomerase
MCGITSISDALAAVDAGADAIGLVFYNKSPRAVSIAQAAEIAAALPAFVTCVALFVDPSKEDVNHVLANVSVDLLQFHGNESAQFCAQFNCRFMKAIRVREETDLHQICSEYSAASALLLDTYKAGIPGGTGEVFNWSWIPSQLSLPVVLAGGLERDNVAKAIKQVKPFAVDVSGGIEKDKGIKDANKMNEFMKEVFNV